MKKFFISILTVTAVLSLSGLALYLHQEAQCAPIIQERMERGYDNAPTFCGALFYLYVPIAFVIWILSLAYFILKVRKQNTTPKIGDDSRIKRS